MNWILLALCLISLAGHLLILERLPEQIPVHWNAAGEIDGYGPKSMDLIMGGDSPGNLGTDDGAAASGSQKKEL